MQDHDEAKAAARAHIERALRITGMSPTRLAREAGLAASTLVRFLNSDTKHSLSMRTLTKVDDAVKRMLNQKQEMAKVLAREQTTSTGQEMNTVAGQQYEDMSPVVLANIPVVSWVQAGLFTASSIPEEISSEDFISVPTKRPWQFALRVQGDSMSLVAPPGSVITVDPRDRALIDKKLYIFRNGSGECTIKQYRCTEGPVRLEPRSYSPYYRTIYPEGEIDVIGRVTGVHMDL